MTVGGNVAEAVAGVQGTKMVAGVLFAVVGKVNGPVTESRPFNTSCVAPSMTD